MDGYSWTENNGETANQGAGRALGGEYGRFPAWA